MTAGAAREVARGGSPVLARVRGIDEGADGRGGEREAGDDPQRGARAPGGEPERGDGERDRQHRHRVAVVEVVGPADGREPISTAPPPPTIAGRTAARLRWITTRPTPASRSAPTSHSRLSIAAPRSPTSQLVAAPFTRSARPVPPVTLSVWSPPICAGQQRQQRHAGQRDDPERGQHRPAAPREQDRRLDRDGEDREVVAAERDRRRDRPPQRPPPRDASRKQKNPTAHASATAE